MFYDGSCPFCTRSANLLQRLDWFQKFRFLDLHTHAVLDQAGIDVERALQRLQVKSNRGNVFEGMQAILFISARTPLLWPLFPFFWFVLKLGWGDRIYDWIAARRTLFPLPGRCDLRSGE